MEWFVRVVLFVCCVRLAFVLIAAGYFGAGEDSYTVQLTPQKIFWQIIACCAWILWAIYLLDK